MRGMAAAFEALGMPTRSEILSPDHTAIPRTVALLRGVLSAPACGPGVILLRSHWSLTPAVPYLRALRSRGHYVVIDCPTPAAAGLQEIRHSDRGSWNRAVRLANEAAWTPLAWPAASLVIQYAHDANPWRRLAAQRRVTLTNGVDVASRPINDAWVTRDGVTFVCAGALGPWHGLDRLLWGMSAQGDTSRLLVMGQGPDTARISSLAVALGLTERVEFHGSQVGAHYDAVMARADIGVASLAEHRRGGHPLSPLKTRDYLARGMPVLFGGDDPDLHPTPTFTYRLPADDSAVPVAQVGAWLSRLRRQATTGAPAAGPAAIKTFAAERLDLASRAEAVLAALGLRPS